MHQRRTAASATSSKVAASRERRARRGNKLNNGGGIRSANGHLPLHSKHHAEGNNAASGKRLLVIAIGLIVIFLLLVWGGALFHVTTNADGAGDGDSGKWKIGKVSLPKNALGRLRNDKSKYQSDPDALHSVGGSDLNPYTADALEKNPYLGWQPPLVPSPLGDSFSWRKCFKADAKSDGSDQPAGCHENPAELGEAPVVSKDWVPDVTMIRKMVVYGKDRDGNPFPPPLSEELCEDIGVTGGKNGDINKECVRESSIRSLGPLDSHTVKISPSNHYGEEVISNESIEVPSPKIMCLVYTMADAHANRIRGMRETWAGGCDGFLAFSTESDPRLPAISLEHEGPEAYENMWQKVRSIWKFVGTHYLEDYDWFFIGGDDLFVMPYNLKTYLASLVHKDGTDPKSKEYFVGRRFNSGGHDYFNSGGAGYTLSQATLRKFLTVMDDARHCSADKRTSMEDVMIARCLRHLDIQFTDTRDANGRERFHPFAPGSHLHWKPPGAGQPRDWYEDYNKEWGLLLGKDACAPDSVSFHYIKKASMVRHMQALLYSCDVSNR
jgi:glycoprotein-N-acetylgalactosamine 3-beta-galactosyltransferase